MLSQFYTVLLTISQRIGNFLYRIYEKLRLKKLINGGLKIGKNVYISHNVNFDSGHPHLIEIGNNCRIARGVRILSHDATTFRGLGATRAAKVRILDGTFIGENAIILPGVTIGPNALVTAGAVVNRDIGEDLCAAGNPARAYGKYSDLLKRVSKEINEDNFFDISMYDNQELTTEEIRSLCDRHGTVFFSGLHEFDPCYVNTDFAELRKEHGDALARLRRGIALRRDARQENEKGD